MGIFSNVRDFFNKDVEERDDYGDHDREADTDYDDYEDSKKSVLRFAERKARTHKIVKFKGNQHGEKMSEAARLYKEGHAVYLNFDDSNKDAMTRALDFLGGVAFGLDGSLKRVSNTVFAVIPKGDEIGGDVYDDAGHGIDDIYDRG